LVHSSLAVYSRNSPDAVQVTRQSMSSLPAMLGLLPDLDPPDIVVARNKHLGRWGIIETSD
jgi:hypothetical protein